jgi:hypothetical protein
MNNIGIGIFCFGEEYYYRGTIEKINNILNGGYHCYILTENTDFFTKKYAPSYLHVFEYDRSIKSYADKMSLPKHILKNHDICILIDADTHIKDYSFLDDLRHFNFKEGISFIDTLLNHRAKREFVKDLINKDSDEWKPYVNYIRTLYPNYGNLITMWEYFLVINKNGFNSKEFYYNYERLQLVKEYSDISLKKDVYGAGEGISIQVSGKLSNTNVERDMELYELIKDKMVSISKRHTKPELWPNWMK